MRHFAHKLILLTASILLVGCISNSQSTPQTPSGRDADVANVASTPPTASTNPPPRDTAAPHTTGTPPTEHAMGNDPSQPLTETPQSLILTPGESAHLGDGSRLTYLKLVNDSRCPPNAQCIWAGNAEIELRWAPVDGGPEGTFSLNTSPVGGKPVSKTIGNFEVRIHSLDRGPEPAATLEIKPTSP